MRGHGRQDTAVGTGVVWDAEMERGSVGAQESMAAQVSGYNERTRVQGMGRWDGRQGNGTQDAGMRGCGASRRRG